MDSYGTVRGRWPSSIQKWVSRQVSSFWCYKNSMEKNLTRTYECDSSMASSNATLMDSFPLFPAENCIKATLSAAFLLWNSLNTIFLMISGAKSSLIQWNSKRSAEDLLEGQKKIQTVATVNGAVRHSGYLNMTTKISTTNRLSSICNASFTRKTIVQASVTSLATNQTYGTLTTCSAS